MRNLSQYLFIGILILLLIASILMIVVKKDEKPFMLDGSGMVNEWLYQVNGCWKPQTEDGPVIILEHEYIVCRDGDGNILYEGNCTMDMETTQISLDGNQSFAQVAGGVFDYLMWDGENVVGLKDDAAVLKFEPWEGPVEAVYE